jgi:hypothetical protein
MEHLKNEIMRMEMDYGYSIQLLTESQTIS